MADLEHHLRRHYESKKLPEDRARAILAAGRAAAAARTRRWRWWLSAAAALVLGAGLLGGFGAWHRGSNHASRIVSQDAAAAVMRHFASPDYQLAEVSADPAVLTRWLRDHGAPASLAVPPAMAGLASFGCQVLEAQEKRVYLICFFLDVPAVPPTPGSMPIKKEMVVTAPDGSMMKKNRPLVHLVVAPRSAFRDAPAPGTRVNLPPSGEWNFTTWSSGDVVYLVAATAPAERIADLTRSL